MELTHVKRCLRGALESIEQAESLQPGAVDAYKRSAEDCLSDAIVDMELALDKANKLFERRS